MKVILRTACGSERYLDGPGWESRPTIRVPLGVNTIGVTRIDLLDMLSGSGWREFKRSRIAVASNAAEAMLGFEQTVLYQETITYWSQPKRFGGRSSLDLDGLLDDPRDAQGNVPPAMESTYARIVTACGCVRVERLEGLRARSRELSVGVFSGTQQRVYVQVEEKRWPIHAFSASRLNASTDYRTITARLYVEDEGRLPPTPELVNCRCTDRGWKPLLGGKLPPDGFKIVEQTTNMRTGQTHYVAVDEFGSRVEWGSDR